jgi:hypothetical protein
LFDEEFSERPPLGVASGSDMGISLMEEVDAVGGVAGALASV